MCPQVYEIMLRRLHFYELRSNQIWIQNFVYSKCYIWTAFIWVDLRGDHTFATWEKMVKKWQKMYFYGVELLVLFWWEFCMQITHVLKSNWKTLYLNNCIMYLTLSENNVEVLQLGHLIHNVFLIYKIIVFSSVWNYIL